MAVEDITEAKSKAEILAFRADHDALTSLLNRAAYDKCVLQYKYAPYPIAYILMDVDKFKAVNDNYGHDVGDVILKDVAKLLKTEFRISDSVIRMGGDEFAVIAINFPESQKDNLLEKINRINQALLNPTKPVPKVSLSVGVAFSEEGFSEDLYKKADIALYHTKNTTRCGATVYREDLGSAQGETLSKID